MANTLTEVTPKLLAMGLMALRGSTVMPRLVNSDYDSLFAAKGDVVNVPVPSAIAAQAVVPAATPQSAPNIAPTSVPITLDQWYEAPFYLTDKDFKTAMDGTIPMQASEAIKALASNVNQFIFSQYVYIGQSIGTAGTTPFAALTDATNARKILNVALAPTGDRRMVLDPSAEAAALNLAAFRDVSQSTDAGLITEGNIGRKLGFDWWGDQEVPTHTIGTADSAYVVNGAHAIGATEVTVSTGTGTFTAGDLILIAGDTRTYSVNTLFAGGAGDISISPALRVALSGAETVTELAVSSVQNLAFHRDCIAFASRPLLDVEAPTGNIIVQATDSVSGLSLRLEVSREHKRTRFSYDLLYGGAVVRPDLGVRVLG